METELSDDAATVDWWDRVACSDPSELEQKWLLQQLRLLRVCDNSTRGFFAEFLVADMLGPDARLTRPWEHHDVDWDGIEIQVKCSGGHQTWYEEGQVAPAEWTCSPTSPQELREGRWFNLPKRLADVWVLCRHEGTQADLGWVLYVLSAADLRPGPDQLCSTGGSVTAARLRKHSVEPIQQDSPDALRAAVRRAAQRAHQAPGEGPATPTATAEP